MADQPSTNVMNFFSEYVRLRQSGCPVDEAARDLQTAMRMLDKHELNELATMTQHWEATFRARPRMNVPTKRHVTGMLTTRDSQELRTAIRPIQTREAPAEENSMLAILIEETPAIRPIQVKRKATVGANDSLETCGRCGKPNQAGAAFCYACGEILLSSRSSSTRQLEETISTRRKLGASYFGTHSKLLVDVANSGDCIEIFPTERDIVIGRSSSANAALSPDIDLSHYDAETLGVSRLHVSIKRSDKTLTITDMNSSNKTYLNGQVLHPNEVRVLNDNDEIRLGRLYLRIRFVHPS